MAKDLFMRIKKDVGVLTVQLLQVHVGGEAEEKEESLS